MTNLDMCIYSMNANGAEEKQACFDTILQETNELYVDKVIRFG